jgi:hypothetical protein
MMKTYSKLAEQMVRHVLIKLEGRYNELCDITFELEKLARNATASKTSQEKPFKFLEQHGIRTTGDVLKILSDIKKESAKK